MPSPYPAQHNLDDATVFKMTHVTPRSERELGAVRETPPATLPGLSTKEHELFNTLRMKIMTASMTNPNYMNSSNYMMPAPAQNAPQPDVERQLQLLEILARLLATVQNYSSPHASPVLPHASPASPPAPPNSALYAPSPSPSQSGSCNFPMYYIMLGFVGLLLAVMVVLLIIVIRRAARGKEGRRVRAAKSPKSRSRKSAGSDWVETLKNSVRGFDE